MNRGIRTGCWAEEGRSVSLQDEQGLKDRNLGGEEETLKHSCPGFPLTGNETTNKWSLRRVFLQNCFTEEESLLSAFKVLV